MRRSWVLTLAALVSVAATPGIAAWDHLGTVNFSMRDRHDATYPNIRSDAISLSARNSAVWCNSVRATFGNGRTREIYRGEIPRGYGITVDLPGRERNIDRIDFNCRPTERRRAMVDVAANTERLRSGPEQFLYGMSRLLDR